MTSSLFTRFFFIIFLLYVSTCTTFTLPPTGVKLQLIHRCSLPEYSNETFEYIVQRNLKLFQMKFDDAKFNLQTPMIQFRSTGSIYFLNVTIGNPPVPQYVQVDTGSSLTWVSQRSNPPRHYFYDPESSAAFKYISCGDPVCRSENGFICIAPGTNRCGYEMNYLDGTQSSGIVGYDRFGFVNHADPQNPYVVEKVLFGALGNVSKNPINDPQFYGILGMGAESVSLINQLPNPKTFRYCVANLSRPEESRGYIQFGEVDDDDDDIPTTPIIQGYDHYMVEIESICLDEICLEIDPSVFKNVKGNVKTGVVLDTGAVMSFLPDVAYDALKRAVKRIMASKNKAEVLINGEYSCYYGNLNDELRQNYPLLIIQFAGGAARMLISHTEYFVQMFPSKYCLSFRKTSRFGESLKNFTLLGLYTQQYHIFEFNLDDRIMGILGDSMCD